MDDGLPLGHVSADRGGIAAGRDVHLHCDLAICPRCELRLIRRKQTLCHHCLRAERRAHCRRVSALQLEMRFDCG